jgi:protein HOOK3
VSTQLPDNWPLRFTALKRLFRLISQYYTEVLRQTSAIDVPDLQSIAKDYDVDQTLALCRLTIALAVQSSQNQKIIDGIQQLKEDDQHALMRAIETVCAFPAHLGVQSSLPGPFQVMSKLAHHQQTGDDMNE